MGTRSHVGSIGNRETGGGEGGGGDGEGRERGEHE